LVSLSALENGSIEHWVSVASALAAIDVVNSLAGDEACRFKIEDRADNIRDLPHPTKWVQIS
jgi:hypothetical protein